MTDQRSVTTPNGRLLDLTEKQWQAQVVELAHTLQWRKAYHTFDSRRSSSGWPDLVLVRDRVVYAELKSETGRLSDAQQDWIRALLHTGAEVYVWRPSDLDQAARILAHHGDPFQARGPIANAAAEQRQHTWDEAAA